MCSQCQFFKFEEEVGGQWGHSSGQRLWEWGTSILQWRQRCSCRFCHRQSVLEAANLAPSADPVNRQGKTQLYLCYEEEHVCSSTKCQDSERMQFITTTRLKSALALNWQVHQVQETWGSKNHVPAPEDDCIYFLQHFCIFLKLMCIFSKPPPPPFFVQLREGDVAAALLQRCGGV